MKKISRKNYKIYLCSELINREKMEFFIDDKGIENQFQEIFKKIQILRNGETHYEMKKFGLNYSKSLGASIVNLREIANAYSGNHLLAHKLWTKGFRESKILATLLEEPKLVTEAQLERWFNEMDSNELLEQASMNLFVHMEEIHRIVLDWMQSGQLKKELCAIMVAGRMAMTNQEEPNHTFLNFLQLIPLKMKTTYQLNQVKQSLGKIVRRNEFLASEVRKIVLKNKKMNEQWNEVWHGLQYDFEL